MAIKINGQDLKKRYINNQEVLRVYKAWVQVRPDAVFDDYFWISNGGTFGSGVFLRLDGWGTIPSSSRPQLEYSFDKSTWTDYTITSWNYVHWPTITLKVWEKVYFRNKSTTPPSTFSTRLARWTFHGTSGGAYYTWWTLTSLLSKDNTDTLPNYCFNSLFEAFPLLSIPKLTATILWGSCYESLFYNANVQLDTTQHDEYQYPFRFPYTWTISWSPLYANMFLTDRANNYVIAPNVNTTYYCNMSTY